MANPSDAFWQNVTDIVDSAVSRKQQYDQTYNEDHAYRLANAYMQYPWVNPQILVSLVLNDADDALPQVADYAAARMAQIGVTPHDVAAQDDFAYKMQSGLMSEYNRNDPNNDALLSEYMSSLKAVE